MADSGYNHISVWLDSGLCHSLLKGWHLGLSLSLEPGQALVTSKVSLANANDTSADFF